MKVLQINSVCGYGSTGRIATDIYDSLEKKEHECLIAYGRGKSLEKYNTYKVSNNLDFAYHVLKTRFLDLHGFGSKIATKRLVKKIKEYKPDIIHLHNLHGYYLNVEVLFDFLREAKIPVVWLLHDQWPISGHSAYFDLNSKGEIPEKSLNKHQKYEYPKSLIIDNSKRNYKNKQEIFSNVEKLTIVTPSLWLTNLVKKSYLSEYNIETIYNGINLDVFRCRETQKNNKKIVLGVASVWEERKGLKYFDFLANRLDKDYEVVLVGINAKQREKINKKITTIERTSSIEELANIYSQAHVFVNPTLNDNFPTTNIEALACGTPVITFDTGGSPEALTKKTGIVVEKGNEKKLLEAVYQIESMNIKTEECRKQAEKFDLNSVYDKYITIYEKNVKVK